MLYTVSNFPEHQGHGWKFGSNIQESLQSFISVRTSRSSETLLFSTCGSITSSFLSIVTESLEPVAEK